MTKPERKVYMLTKLRSAMAAIQNDPKYDWAKESQSICAAAETLMKAVQKFIDGKLTDETEIRTLYKTYVGMYLRS